MFKTLIAATLALSVTVSAAHAEGGERYHHRQFNGGQSDNGGALIGGLIGGMILGGMLNQQRQYPQRQYPQRQCITTRCMMKINTLRDAAGCSFRTSMVVNIPAKSAGTNLVNDFNRLFSLTL